MPPLNYTPNSWMNMDQLGALMSPGDHSNASLNDPEGIQQFLNMQNSQAPDQMGATDETAPSMDPGSMIQNLPAPAPGPIGYGSGGGRPDMSGINRLLASIDSKNLEGTKLTKDEISRLQAYRDKMPTEREGPDLTGLMALADSWGNDKSNFAGSYKRPETEEERAAKKAAVDLQLAGEGQKLSNTELATLKDKLSGEIAKLHYGQANDQKNQEYEEKDAAALQKALDVDKASGRMSPIGKAKMNVNQAERLQQLLDQYKADPNGMPLEGPSSLSEMAIGLNSLLGGANGGSEASRESLLPKSLRGKGSTLESYLMNRPTGAGMQEFVKNVQDTLNREHDTNANQVKSYLNKINAVSGTGRLAKSNSKRYHAIVDAYLTDSALAPSQNAVGGASVSGGAPASGPHGPMVKQGGVTFNWNPATQTYKEAK